MATLLDRVSRPSEYIFEKDDSSRSKFIYDTFIHGDSCCLLRTRISAIHFHRAVYKTTVCRYEKRRCFT